jgi:hypothetical protein
VTDINGREIAAGSTVCWPQKRDHQVAMAVGVVDSINLSPDRPPTLTIKVLKSIRTAVGRRINVRKTANVVAIVPSLFETDSNGIDRRKA